MHIRFFSHCLLISFELRSVLGIVLIVKWMSFGGFL